MKTTKNQIKYDGQHAYLALVIDSNNMSSVCNICSIGSVYDNKEEAMLEANTLAKQIQKQYNDQFYPCVGYGQITRRGKLHGMKIVF